MCGSVSRSASGILSSIKKVSRTGDDAQAPEAAVDDSGGSVIAWTPVDGSGGLQVQMRTRGPDGTLGTIRKLSVAGETVFDAVVGVDPDGEAVFAWEQLVGVDHRIKARALATGRALEPDPDPVARRRGCLRTPGSRSTTAATR